MALGFSIENNLAESDSPAKDSGILDNLAGAGISNDIRLFDGNTNRRSEIASNEYVIENGEYVISAEGMVPFSDGTLISYGSTPLEYKYKVVDSDTISRFKLVDTTNSDAPFSGAGEPLFRSDTITQENLFNINTPRPESLLLSREQSADSVADEAESQDIFDNSTIADRLDNIDIGISAFLFKKSRVVLTNIPTNISNSVTFSGNITIVNNAGIDTSGDQGPGLFIVSPDTGDVVRAFTSTSNPWEQSNAGTSPDTNGVISSTADENSNPITETAPYKLTLSNPNPIIKFEAKGGGVASGRPVAATGPITNFTHKLRATINGETYFLLLEE